jgi:tRNA (guanine37-N1)-methyltransferase
MIKPNESVCDMFCGVGPLSIQAAKKHTYVTANDLNPECYKYLKINSKKNKVGRRVIPFGIDAREFFIAISRHPQEFLTKQQSDLTTFEDYHELKHVDLSLGRFHKFHHIYMNLPAIAIDFLDCFKGWWQYRD